MKEVVCELLIQNKVIENVPQMISKNGTKYRTFEVELEILDIYDYMKENNLIEFDYNDWRNE